MAGGRNRPGALAAAVVLLMCLPGATRAATAEASDPPSAESASVYHLFLKDGTAIATLGEFARVGDRVVFTLPLSSSRRPLASVPADQVDWEQTDRHTYAVRAARYAETRGERDFAEMSALVARTLSDIAITPGVQAQLALAERARRVLAAWPRDHYNYRAEEVRQNVALLDEVIAGLRAAAGQTQFDVNFVAQTEPPPVVPIRKAPTLRESIAQALRLADLAATPTERIALLEEVHAVAAESAGHEAWAREMRERAREALEAEREVSRSYAALAARALRDIDARVRKGDVRALLRTRARVIERDAALGHKRPGEVQALLATLDERLDAARRLRLARDRWAAQKPALETYRREVRPWTNLLERSREALAEIRALAGPPLDRIRALIRAFDRERGLFVMVRVPEAAATAHASLTSAVRLTEAAALLRERAVMANDMVVARDASAAAAGALLLYDRVQKELEALFRPPESADPE